MKKKALALIALLLIPVLFAGCGKSAAYDKAGGAYPSSNSYASSSSPVMSMMEGADEIYSMDGEYSNYSVETEYSLKENPVSVGKTSANNSLDPDKGLKIIYTANMDVQTDAWDDNYPKLIDLIGEYKGYLQDSSVSGGYTSTSGYYNTRSANLTIRIPSENYRPFLDAMDASVSTITSLNEYTDDITAAYVDTEARIKTLKAQEVRLLALLENAGDLSDLLEIERELANVRYQIESFTSTMNTFKSLLSYSTITINIREVSTVVIPKDTFGQRVVAALIGSGESIVEFFDKLIIALIYVIPYVALTLIIVFVIRRITRKKRLERKERKRLAKEQQPTAYNPIDNQYTQPPTTPPTAS